MDKLDKKLAEAMMNDLMEKIRHIVCQCATLAEQMGSQHRGEAVEASRFARRIADNIRKYGAGLEISWHEIQKEELKK